MWYPKTPEVLKRSLFLTFIVNKEQKQPNGSVNVQGSVQSTIQPKMVILWHRSVTSFLRVHFEPIWHLLCMQQV